MKKIFFLVVLFFILSLSAGKALAVESNLIIDPSREVPDYKIVPPPAPSPQKDRPESYEDIRSWTKFEYSKIISAVAKKYNLDPQV
ncbi:hypothetical protein HY945_04110, partial [Candidatus Gottesmanbacteria bacterium]|nr:hypothetical protein [Candidatus Gottesmanbacteria bacterium]